MTHGMAKFTIGEIVRHRLYPFRGVVIDVDPEFDNTDEWYESIPAEVRPHKDQPFYHVFAENDDVFYTAYVSQQNLLIDESNEPVAHPDVNANFGPFNGKVYEILQGARNQPANKTETTKTSIAFLKSELLILDGEILIF